MLELLGRLPCRGQDPPQRWHVGGRHPWAAAPAERARLVRAKQRQRGGQGLAEVKSEAVR